MSHLRFLSCLLKCLLNMPQAWYPKIVPWTVEVLALPPPPPKQEDQCFSKLIIHPKCSDSNSLIRMSNIEINASRSEPAKGRRDIAALRVCSVVYLASYILRQLFW